MKYLKYINEVTFYDVKDDFEFKKYLILNKFRVGKKYYTSIVRVDTKEKQNVEISGLYMLIKGKIIKIKEKKIWGIWVNNYYLQEELLFQSDDLQKCIDILPIIKDTKKYNL